MFKPHFLGKQWYNKFTISDVAHRGPRIRKQIFVSFNWAPWQSTEYDANNRIRDEELLSCMSRNMVQAEMSISVYLQKYYMGSLFLRCLTPSGRNTFYPSKKHKNQTVGV
jgi:hypothetical protein